MKKYLIAILNLEDMADENFFVTTAKNKDEAIWKSMNNEKFGSAFGQSLARLKKDFKQDQEEDGLEPTEPTKEDLIEMVCSVDDPISINVMELKEDKWIKLD